MDINCGEQAGYRRDSFVGDVRSHPMNPWTQACAHILLFVLAADITCLWRSEPRAGVVDS